MRSACELFNVAGERGIHWADVSGVEDDAVYRLLLPEQNEHESPFDRPNWGYEHSRFATDASNLRLPQEECRKSAQPLTVSPLTTRDSAKDAARVDQKTLNKYASRIS